MPRQYQGPLAGPPAYLSPAAEVRDWKRPAMSRSAFIVLCVDTLVGLDLTVEQACEVTANTLVETARGEKFRAWNLGGVKATKAWAEAYKKRTGRDAPWWRAGGNLDSGDSDTVFYRGYVDARDFFDEWLRTFVPKPGTVGPGLRYARTGEAFWRGVDWFPRLIEAGYKGPVTKAKPQASIKDHRALVQAALTRWAQTKLGVVADGVWGPKSRTACGDFQVAHRLPVSCEPDPDTTRLLAYVRL